VAPLVELARAGDQGAFAVLMTPLLPPGFALAASLSPDPAAAEDALQEALLKAWGRLRQLREEGKLRSCFLGIVFNECRMARRRRRRSSPGPCGRPRACAGSWISRAGDE
jgi:RNA polymerase sigma-70 factor (ECF subfamily)